jgi:predicted component of type VI protein secretion system
MGRFAKMLAGLLAAVVLLTVTACANKSTPPPMPEAPNPQPGPGADALEVERYRLEEEKRTLAAKYGGNIDRIKQINLRLIEINIELGRRGGQP